MSIKSIDQLLQNLTPGIKATGTEISEGGSEFERAMARALSVQGPRDDGGRLQVEMMRLEMMRGLLATGLENEDETWAPPVPWGNLSSLYPSSSQILDKSEAGPMEGSPPPVHELIDRAAAEHGVEPALVRAVVKAESDFNPRAVSPVGAEGLMQLMPETAKDLGVTDPFDPEQNIRGGTRYLSWLLDKYGGDIDKTLAAYNWGPGNVDRKGIEALPKETRNYLVKVKGYLG